ncbi:MAG: hypothetical protein E7680_05415 [Ruminococcaceae bacterium]|nr:hypothetical protein [Oscillospiraceae bacterium]
MAVSKIRTNEELQNPDLNYFIAFNIEPTETNVKKIEDALNEKRKSFTRTVTATSTRLNELKDDINEIMLNDAVYGQASDGSFSYTPKSGGRKQEAEAAKKFYLARAIKMAESLCQSGYIEDIKISELAKRFYVTDKEILEGIAGLLSQGVELKKVVGVKREIAFANFKKMEDHLRTVGKKDLYDFSGLPETATTSELLAKQEALYTEFSKKATDAKSKGGMDLTGIGKVVFKSDAARKEYDVYRKTKVRVWDVLNNFSSSGLSTINDKVFIECIDALRAQAGLSPEEAEKELYAYMTYLKISRESTAKIKIQVCPYPECGKSFISQQGSRVCPNCGKPLEIKCWNCGEPMAFVSISQACPKCGIAPQNQQQFDIALKEFGTILKTPSASEVEIAKVLNQLENIVPGYEQFPDSFTSKAIHTAKEQLEKKKKDDAARDKINEKYVKELQRLIVNKAFFEAQQLIKQLKNEDPTYNTKTFDDKIESALKNSQQMVDVAQKALQSNDETQAVVYASKALEVCCDFPAAIQILKSYPPKAPCNVVAHIVRNSVKLDWQVTGDQNAITYTVIRKIGSAPTNVDDGDIMEKDLSINTFEDVSCVSATAYYYGIFAVRGGVVSSVSVTKDASVLFMDVKNIHQEKVGDSIKATWQAPDNVKAIEVYKRVGVIPPSVKEDGVQLAGSNLNGFHDTDLTDDKNSYLVICKYEYLGKEEYSKGIKVSYTRFRLPCLLQNIAITSAGTANEFHFTCDQPNNGTVKLYTSSKNIEFAFGEADDLSNFAQKCRDLQEINVSVISGNKLYFTIPEASILWLYPVIANEQLYVMSQPILINSVVGIESITAISKNDSVMIEGALNANARNLIAVISPDSFVQSIEKSSDKRTCTADTFRNEKGLYISLKPGIHYITLFAEFNEGGNVFYSRPTPLPEVIDNREKTVVQYALTYTVSTSAPYKTKIDFKADVPLELPEIDLVIGYPKPLSKNNGVVIATVPSGQLKKKFLKSGYYYSVEQKVERANSMKDKIALFFHSDSEKHIQLKPVIKI